MDERLSIGKAYYGKRWHLLTNLVTVPGYLWAECGVEIKRGTVSDLAYDFGSEPTDCRHCLARKQRLDRRKNDE